MEAPKISTKTDLSLEESKREFRELQAHLKNCPRFGWISHIENAINNRMDYLRKTITDIICEVTK